MSRCTMRFLFVLTIFIVMSVAAEKPEVVESTSVSLGRLQRRGSTVPHASPATTPEIVMAEVLKAIAAHAKADDAVVIEKAIAALIKVERPEAVVPAIKAMIQADQENVVVKALIAMIEADKSGEIIKSVRKVFSRWDATEGFPEASHIAALTYVGRLKEKQGKTEEADKLWGKLMRLLKED